MILRVILRTFAEGEEFAALRYSWACFRVSTIFSCLTNLIKPRFGLSFRKYSGICCCISSAFSRTWLSFHQPHWIYQELSVNMLTLKTIIFYFLKAIFELLWLNMTGVGYFAWTMRREWLVAKTAISLKPKQKDTVQGTVASVHAIKSRNIVFVYTDVYLFIVYLTSQ